MPRTTINGGSAIGAQLTKDLSVQVAERPLIYGRSGHVSANHVTHLLHIPITFVPPTTSARPLSTSTEPIHPRQDYAASSPVCNSSFAQYRQLRSVPIYARPVPSKATLATPLATSPSFAQYLLSATTSGFTPVRYCKLL